MPYISQERRQQLEPQIIDGKIHWPPVLTVGELNYRITQLVMDYVNRVGQSYIVMNDVIGAMESAKLEFYRRIVVPYEDTKIQQNGDVYLNMRGDKGNEF